jgi:hypothetical protein
MLTALVMGKKREGKNPLGRHRRGGRIILKCVLME